MTNLSCYSSGYRPSISQYLSVVQADIHMGNPSIEVSLHFQTCSYVNYTIFMLWSQIIWYVESILVESVWELKHWLESKDM